MTRSLLGLGLLVIALSACNQSALSTGDGSAVDLAGACGTAAPPQIEVNGRLAASPFVTGAELALNCCEGGQFQIVSAQIPEPVFFMWRVQAPLSPTTVDLANLPPAWSVSLYSGCDRLQTNCHPSDTYDSGLVGSLSVSRSGTQLQMSVCLTAEEPTTGSHPVLHSVRLWSGTVLTQ